MEQYVYVMQTVSLLGGNMLHQRLLCNFRHATYMYHCYCCLVYPIPLIPDHVFLLWSACICCVPASPPLWGCFRWAKHRSAQIYSLLPKEFCQTSTWRTASVELHRHWLSVSKLRRQLWLLISDGFLATWIPWLTNSAAPDGCVLTPPWRKRTTISSRFHSSCIRDVSVSEYDSFS